MTIQRMDHVGVVVDDLEAATEFFVELGLQVQGEAAVEGSWVDRIIGLNGVRSDVVGMKTPDGNTWLELSKFHSPPSKDDDRPSAPNTRGLRHIAFVVDDIDAVVARLQSNGTELIGSVERYTNNYRLCYVRGPEGIIVELAEQIG
jgi:catechol 2,3-dioxygenase-like lactoylglutathione lyase family enzyme